MSEKIQVARNSALASLAMTVLKLGAGLSTGSLGLISEGMHSAVDFLATLTTFLSVRAAERPADATHHYGHGKVENLSAFAEALLLLGTAVFIVAKAVSRLQGPKEKEGLHTSGVIYYAAIGVMVLAMVVDVWRSIALARAAKKYRSQALEADALHFTVELLSSAAVLVGLIVLKIGGPGWEWVDPAAAIGVAAVMVFVAGNMAKRSGDALIDRAPDGLEEELQRTIRQVPGVEDVPRVRARQSGAQMFIDATITVDPALGLAGGHQVASLVELAVTEQHRNMDILVHVEPAEDTQIDNIAAVRELARANGLQIHALRVREIQGGLYVNFHLDLPPAMTIAQAHAVVTDLEQKIRLRLPKVAEIDSHMEPSVAE